MMILSLKRWKRILENLDFESQLFLHFIYGFGNEISSCCPAQMSVMKSEMFIVFN